MSYIRLIEQTEPITPPTDRVILYVDSVDNGAKIKLDDGNIIVLGVEGDGDVIGPASAIDNALSRFDGITGKLIQSSNVILDDSDILSGLQEIKMRDSKKIHFGSNDDMHIRHSGISGQIENEIGDLIIVSKINADGIKIKTEGSGKKITNILGTADNSTSFEVQDNLGNVLLSVLGDGNVGIGDFGIKFPSELLHILVDGVSHYDGSDAGVLVTGSSSPRYLWEDNSEPTDKRIMTIVNDNQNLVVRSSLDSGALDVNDILTMNRDGIVSTHLTILQGGRTFSTSTNTATLNMVGTYMCVSTGMPRTLTISSADIAKASPLKPWTFEVLDISGGAGDNSITIDTEGSQKINGVGSVDISVNYGSIIFTCDGSNLFIRSTS